LLVTLSHSLSQADAADADVAADPLFPELDEALPPEPQGPLAWAYAHRRIDGRPFSLNRFLPLEALYADDHPHKCVIKPAQRGVSEYAINFTGFALDRGAEVWTDNEKEGLNVAYIFPKKEALGDFSKERLSGLIHESSYLEELFGDDDYNAITFKQVGGSYLYLRGGWSTSALKSFPADVLVLDEYDEMASQAIALARRRLNASLVKRELDISTPSIPQRGIHALWLQSDRRVYEQPHACGAWVRYDFLRDVRVDNEPSDLWQQWPAEQMYRLPVTLHCPSCDQVVSDDERVCPGRWTAEAPEVIGLRGYWIPPLAFSFVDLVRLCVNAVNPDPSEREEFFRSDLGLPYTVGGSRVTLTMLLQLSAQLLNGQLPKAAWRDTTMGVDVGARWHYRISSTGPDGGRYVRAMGAASSWEDLDALMSRYRVRQCVIDALPELDGTKRWQGRYRGRVMRAFYPSAATALKGQLYGVRSETGVIDINRTMAMDHLYAVIARCEEHWPADVVLDPEVQAHMSAPIRTLTINPLGQEIAGWVHASADHSFHAALYDRIAYESLPSRSQFAPAAGGSLPGFEAPIPGDGAPRPMMIRRPGQPRSADQQLRSVLEQHAIAARIPSSFGLLAPPRRLGRRRRL
jgi:hypothetical protein